MDNRGYRADDRLNHFTDNDDMWGPLLFLRPEQHRVITPLRVLALAGIMGVFYGMLGNAMLALLAKTGSAGKPSALVMPLLLTGMYFVCAQLSIVAAWNRRARQLSRRLDWVQLTRRSSRLPPPAGDQQEAE